MAATSDERREVAERLRDLAARVPRDVTMDGLQDVLEERDFALGIQGVSPREAIRRLADLIDPTCRNFGGEEGTNGEGYEFACTACGWCGDVTDPNYCPNCGCRIVGGRADA